MQAQKGPMNPKKTVFQIQFNRIKNVLSLYANLALGISGKRLEKVLHARVKNQLILGALPPVFRLYANEYKQVETICLYPFSAVKIGF